MAPRRAGRATIVHHHHADLFQVLRSGTRPLRAMTEWTLLKRLLDAVHQHSTMIGRLWLTVMVIFRLLVVAVAAEDVYADEQEMFVCNTLQPGCPNVCYDAFAPVSQPRFWVFHIITVSTPSLCFIVYTWHSLSKRVTGGHRGAGEACGRSCDSDSCSVKSHRHLGHSLADVLEGIAAQKKAGTPSEGSSGVLSNVYVLHVCFRAVLEVGFLTAQWLLYGFRVPAHYVCSVAPCTHRVDCYVSRPTEKTVFLVFMFCVGAFCIFLNLLELNHLGWKKIRRSMGVKESSWRDYGLAKRDGRSVASLTFRDTASTASLPPLDLVVEHRADWTCSGMCSPLKGQGDDSPQTDLCKTTQPPKAKTHKGRGSKPKSAEVWI